MGLFSPFRSIQWGHNRDPGRHGMGNCSQCNSEPATGSVRMANGKFVKVGRGCKRAMGTSGQKQYEETKQRQDPEKNPEKHSNGSDKPGRPGGGKHRAGTRKGGAGGRGRK